MGQTPPLLEFGELQLDEELRRRGERVALPPRSLELLRYLIRHRERVVTESELLREVWGGASASEGSLAAALGELRRALGDDGAQPRWLQGTCAGGYRFAGEVRVRRAALVEPGAGDAGERAAGEPAGRTLLAGNLPPLPRVVVGREGDLAVLRQRLLEPGCWLGAVHGWPGVGKTTLAALLARDAALAARYPDGVLWASLGTARDALYALKLWARALGLAALAQECSHADELAQRLARLIPEKRLLLIADDLWRREDFAALRIGGAQAGLLVTTRQAALADEIASGAERYELGALSTGSALELLGRLLPQTLSRDAAAARQLVGALQGLPLAVHVAAGLLKAEAQRGFSAQDLLKELLAESCRASESALSGDPIPEASPVLSALLRRSTDSLAPAVRERFASLGVFVEKPAAFDEAAIRAVWAIDDPRPTLGELLERGLLEAAGNGSYQMHAVLKSHAEALLESGR